MTLLLYFNQASMYWLKTHRLPKDLLHIAQRFCIRFFINLINRRDLNLLSVSINVTIPNGIYACMIRLVTDTENSHDFQSERRHCKTSLVAISGHGVSPSQQISVLTQKESINHLEKDIYSDENVTSDEVTKNRRESDESDADSDLRFELWDNLRTASQDPLDDLVIASKKTSEIDVDEYFLTSLSPNYVGKRHPDAEMYVKRGIKNKKLRYDLTKRLFDIFRDQCFNGELPESLIITWNTRLRKTAGLCRNKSDRTSCIELSPKVCSTPDRVRDTLVHEMCHAAVWIVDGQRKEGHGRKWREWASKCMRRFRSLPIIDRCHNYEIQTKFIYECEGCGQQIRRHTKSLNVERWRCGICKCSFTLNVCARPKNSGVVPVLNPFAKFVKENYAKHKNPSVKHGEVR
ncbi:hypothetical protein DICVIV_12394 [Dictyocaulus viviparus]|uniref:SprT-like domain-containing protein n=1 Tax=Dictyocaulus viviparus TaxID=29172 RepID=A0A0D8XAM0_DICVI|nr:hypothetical protein DICVIV_12394 [Dictyocaulus viviparus]